MGETKREKRQLVEDLRRFLQIWSLICKVSSLEPQQTAGNRRKSQEAVSTPFSHLVSPIKRCPNLIGWACRALRPVFEYEFWLWHVHWLRGVNKQVCQASQHCRVNLELRLSPPIIIWANWASMSCKGLLVLRPVCVARSDGTHQQQSCRVWKWSRHTSHGSGRANAVGFSPWTAMGGGPRNAQCQQCQSRCHDLHTLGPPRPCLFFNCRTNTTVRKAMQDMHSGVYLCWRCLGGLSSTCKTFTDLVAIRFPKQGLWNCGHAKWPETRNS